MHGYTYAGHPVACAAALASLKIVRDERLPENAARQGDYLMTKVKPFAERYSAVGDVRGKGLMLGIELVKDRATKEPGKAECAQVLELTRDLGLLLGKGGLHGSVIRFAPPMCITKADADFMLEVFDRAFASL